MTQELGFKEYIGIAIRRKWILIGSLVSAVFLFIFYLIFQRDMYQSSAMLMIELEPSDPDAIYRYYARSQGMFQGEQAKPLEYYQSVLGSRALRSELMQRIEADDSLWGYLPKNPDELARVAAAPISLIPSPGYENFVMLVVRSPHPRISYRLASIVTVLLKEQCKSLGREELQNAVNYIEQQKDEGRRNLDEAEKTLQEFKKTHHLAMAQDGGGAMRILSDMEEKLTAIETEKQFAAANLAAYARRLEQMEASGVQKGAGIESPVAARYREDLDKLERQRSELIRLNRKDDAAIADIDSRIEEKKREMISRLLKSSRPEGEQGGDAGISLWKEVYERKITEELNHFVLENRERYYRNQIEEFKRRNPKLMENAVELMRLTRSQTVSENLYTFLLQQGEEAKIKAAAGTGGIRIVDMPEMPLKPVPINFRQRLGMFLVMGLGLGLGIIIVLEMFDHSFRSAEEVDTFLKLPVLGQIPVFPGTDGFSKALRKKDQIASHFWNHLKGKPKDQTARTVELESHPERFIISQLKPKDPVVEAYRTLRSNLHFSTIDGPIKTLLVTSPDQGEGKTMTAANLGIILALLGKSVCVVDADLRKPKQHAVFRLKQSLGLTECLIDNHPVSKIIQKSGIDNLSVVTSGKLPPNPAEVIESKRLQSVISELRKLFDYTIFDSPPVLAVTDAVLLASHLDGVILIVKHESTDRVLASTVVESLRKAKVKIFGAVLNQVVLRSGYGHYYSSRYYY